MKIFAEKSIHSMIKSGNLKKLQKTVTADLVNLPDEDGHASLYYAVHYGRLEIARFLLELGSATGLGSSSDEIHVMHEVLECGLPAMIRLFLEYGEYLPDNWEGRPILYTLALKPGFSPEQIDLLAEYGKQINAVDPKMGMTVLAFVLAQEQFPPANIEVLLQAGADPNSAGDSDRYHPLCQVIRNDAIPSVSRDRHSVEAYLTLLVKYGLDFNAIDKLTQTLLIRRRLETFIQLLEMGLVMDIAPEQISASWLNPENLSSEFRQRLVAVNEERELGLALCLEFYNARQIKKRLERLAPGVEELNQYLFEITTHTDLGVREKTNLLKTVLAKGADINFSLVQGGFSFTPLMALCWKSAGGRHLRDLIAWLIERGAKIEVGGASAFLYAIWGKDMQAALQLAKLGANIAYVDGDGESALAKIFSPHPKHIEWDDVDESAADFLRMLHDLYEKSGLKFPLDTDVSYIAVSDRQRHQRPLVDIVLRHFRGATRLELIAALIDCGWEINRSFTFHGPGNLVNQILRSAGTTSEELITLFERYPEADITTAEDAFSPLHWAFCGDDLKGFSLPVMKRFIERCADINEVFSYTYEQGSFKQRHLNYLGIAIQCTANRGELERGWGYEVCKMLLEAGCDPNCHNRYVAFTDQTGLAGGLRLGHSLLEFSLWKARNLELFKLLLDYGADPHKPTAQTGECTEHFLAYGMTGNMTEEHMIDAYEELDKRGLFQVNAKSVSNATPLAFTTNKGRVKLSRYLLEKGADIDVIGGFHQSSLIHRTISNWDWVSAEDRRAVVALLLDYGADKDFICPSYKKTPLMHAASWGCLSVVEELIERGADPNIADEQGRRAVHFAVQDNHRHDTMPDGEYWTEEGADPEELELQREYKAEGFPQNLKGAIIACLADGGADLNVYYNDGVTPLIDALGFNYAKLVDWLLSNGADPEAVDYYGRTPLMIALQYSNFELAQEFIRNYQPWGHVCAQTVQGENIIHFMARRPVSLNHGFFDHIFDERKVPYVTSHQGITPLHLAALHAKDDLIPYLAARGIDMNEQDLSGNTPLIYTVCSDPDVYAEEKVAATLEALIQGGAQVNRPNNEGKTPLGLALEHERGELVSLLLERGAVEAGMVGFK
jgi:ankyrin repeat protein